MRLKVLRVFIALTIPLLCLNKGKAQSSKPAAKKVTITGILENTKKRTIRTIKFNSSED